MKRIALCLCSLFVIALAGKAQTPDIKFIADTLVVQAEGTFDADPDLATLTFDISSQDKDLKPTYDKAAEAMQKIAALAEKNGLKKEDVSSGVLRVTPFYGGDRKNARNLFSFKARLFSRCAIFRNWGRSWTSP